MTSGACRGARKLRWSPHPRRADRLSADPVPFSRSPASQVRSRPPDADQLLVDEFIGPEAAKLAAEAGALDTAERQLGAVGADEVDEHHARVEVGRDPQGLRRGHSS